MEEYLLSQLDTPVVLKDGTLCYLLYDWDEQGQYVKAHEGQWLCEGYDGKWTVTDEPPTLSAI